MSRVRIPEAAGAELARRYREREAAERRLSDLLLGVVLGVGLSTDDVVGFDDATNDLLMRDPADQPEAPS